MRRTHPLELRALEVFVAVVNAKSITGAAKILNLTQPAVSKTIKTMECSLRVRLLERDGRPIRPTLEGEKLFSFALDVIARTSEAMIEIQERNPPTADNLTIAIVDSLARTLASGIVRNLGYMARRWQFVTCWSSDWNEEFYTGQCKLAIVAEEDTTAEFLIDSYLLLEEPFFVVLPKDYDGDPYDLSGIISNLNLVRYSRSTAAGRKVEQHLNRLKLAAPLWVESDSLPSQLELIASGACWGYLTPTFLMMAPDLLDQVKVVPPRGPCTFRRIVLLVRRGELGSLPELIAFECRDILTKTLLPPILKRYDWASTFISIPTYNEKYK